MGRTPGCLAARELALKRFRSYSKRYPPMTLALSVAAWSRHRSRAVSRTGKAVLPSTLRADLRHLREALLRVVPTAWRCDIYRCPEVRDLRDAYDEEAKRRMTVTATPLLPVQAAALLRAATRSSGIAIVVLTMMCGGAVRHRELIRPETRIVRASTGTTWSLWRVPKRGSKLEEASIPSTPTTDAVILQTVGEEGRLMNVASLAEVNMFIKGVMRGRSDWDPGGRYSSYSIRHGSIREALKSELSPEHIRLQTAHARKVPSTYLRHHNPNQRIQLRVADAMLSKVLRTECPASEDD